ncbi:MAG: HD family phosphohydrolase [Clostridium sp.]
MKLKGFIKERNDKSKRAFVFTVIFVLTFFILVTAIAPKKYKLNVGDIASSDIKAPREIIDEKATEEKIQEVISKVDRQYTLKSEIVVDAKKQVLELMNKISNLNSTENEEAFKLTSIKKVQGFTLSDDDYKVLLSMSSAEATEVGWFLSDVLDKVYENNIAEENQEQLNAAKETALKLIVEKKFTAPIEAVLKEVVYDQIKPNFFYDKEKTEALQRDAQKNVEKETIKKGQIIVSEGEPITEKQLGILTELGYLDEDLGKGNLLTYIMLGIFVFVVLFLQYLYLYNEEREHFDNTKMIVMVAVINIISLVLARGMVLISPSLIPLACAPILITLLIGHRASMVLGASNILLIGVIVGFSPQIIVLALVNALVGATAIKKLQQRNDILYSTLYVAIICGVISICVGFLLTNNVKEILSSTGFAVLGALISGILAVGLLPFFETSFDVVTNVKLLELSNPNHPLMKRLLMEAPGTYHHSMMVANLAEVAAEQVGGNAVVARIGAYYHDIGKIKRPYFFGENQMRRENPHDKITPNLSTLIITSHTKDGVDLAMEYNIPKVIQDIIEQHHGTTLVKYFYYTLKNSSDRPEEIKEEDFRYPGPTPSSKEAGIIMLADSVEAAVRSISDPTKGKIEEMVNNIIKDKLYSDQLVNCDLTFRDIEIIRKSFLKVINGIYHQRIEYPTEKMKK